MQLKHRTRSLRVRTHTAWKSARNGLERMIRRVARLFVAGVVLLLVGGCASVPDVPATTPSPELTARPTATPPPTAPPEPTPTPVTQGLVLGAVGAWAAAQHDLNARSIVYVYEVVSLTAHDFEGEDALDPKASAALLMSGPAQFGAALTDEARAAISTALGAAMDVRLVDDRDEIVDRNAPEHFGCRAFLGRGALLSFAAPRLMAGEEDAFLVAVYVDNGCQGTNELVELRRNGPGYEVTQVVSSSYWIV